VTPRSDTSAAAPSARRPVIAVALALLLAGGAARAAPPARSADAGIAGIADELLAGWLEDRPDLASLAGDHRGDRRLEPVTQASLGREAVRLDALARRLDSVPRADLSPGAALRRDSLATRIAAARTELEVAHRWERDPAAYLDLADGAVGWLLEHGTGSACARVRAVTRRLERVPDVLRAARVNLRAPTVEAIEGALPGYARVLDLYRATLPDFAARCRDPRTAADLAQADTAAVRAVEDFADYLRADLLPRARVVHPAPSGPDSAR